MTRQAVHVILRLMDTVLTKNTLTITDFKANPKRALGESMGSPFAVMTNNRASFYVVSPELFERMIEALEEIEDAALIHERLAAGREPVKVELEDL